MFQKYQKIFAAVLASHLDLTSEDLLPMIVLAPENVEGDLAFPCFSFAKSLQKAPQQIAQDLATKLNATTSDFFASFVAVGPYLNAHLDFQKITPQLLNMIQSQGTGYGAGTSTGQKILLEGRAPNTHKAIHIWHVRNFLLSESIARILQFAGHEVIKACYPGDIGAHVARWIWYYKNFDPQPFPSSNFTRRVGQIYTLATRKLDENPELYKAQIEQLQKDLEDGDPELLALWKETRALCLKDMELIFRELGTEHLDTWYYESQVEQPGIEIINNLYAEGKIQKSQGALGIDLEEFDLGFFLLLKSTGASLYSTKDIALAYQKKSDYPDYDQSLYVVGLEQDHHFQQLFKTLELIGFEQEKLHHISYALVDLIDGKMSSRAGNVVLYEDFRDELLAKSQEMVAERDLSPEQKDQIAHDVAFAAMKFGMLLQDSEKGILFDKETALSFEGETGPYLQYSYARIASILRRATEISFPAAELHLLTHPQEKELLLHLSQFPQIVQRAAAEYKPNIIARYLLGLVKLFSSYYHQAKIIDESDLLMSATRLELVKAVHVVLKNGFELLGIASPESM